MQPIEHAITKLSRNSSRYRGFVVTYRPRTIVNPIARYEVSQGDQSYGLFDAQAQATGYIDQLYAQRREEAMKQAYRILINDLLQQYHFETESLCTASAVADEAHQLSQNDYAFQLSVGLECLQAVARVAGDTESADDLEILIRKCTDGNVPQPLYAEQFAA